jgi:hypothetical protein
MQQIWLVKKGWVPLPKGRESNERKKKISGTTPQKITKGPVLRITTASVKRVYNFASKALSLAA